MKGYHRQSLLNLAYEMNYPIRSDDDLMQFEYELVINGDLPESVLDEPQQQLAVNEVSTEITQILEIVRKLDTSMNPEPSLYQSKKELIRAKARADIKRDSITNKRK